MTPLNHTPCQHRSVGFPWDAPREGLWLFPVQPYYRAGWPFPEWMKGEPPSAVCHNRIGNQRGIPKAFGGVQVPFKYLKGKKRQGIEISTTQFFLQTPDGQLLFTFRLLGAIWWRLLSRFRDSKSVILGNLSKHLLRLGDLSQGGDFTKEPELFGNFGKEDCVGAGWFLF